MKSKKIVPHKETNRMVKQAEELEIPIIEDILLDAVNWMEKNGLQNKTEENS